MAITETVEAVFRIESARVIAGVARTVRDVGIAEELAQDALVAALVQWPESGVPDRPGAWLMATAKHRAIDLVRRKETYARKPAEVGRALEDVPPPGPGAVDADGIDDDLLRLVFTACHPVLSTEARGALTLRLLGGLTTQEIARAFLASEPAVAQRSWTGWASARRRSAPAPRPRRSTGGSSSSSTPRPACNRLVRSTARRRPPPHPPGAGDVPSCAPKAGSLAYDHR
ncbi:hypothetical protein GCM10010446_55480 [Streptomyces enissocaesilis]|uniref:RNA polymerase sigma-70 region 2 domain-containing protein n=1 Tax=Streptomyces enissocaesilis TaxID=332589 RepID=A0ABN3XKQ6_9ACTN